MARYVAKNIVAAGLADRCEVQLAYAIGVSEPVSVSVDTDGTGKIDDARICELVREIFPLTPSGIIKHLDLRRPIYRKTAAGGHFGRNEPEFTWEKTDKAKSSWPQRPPPQHATCQRRRSHRASQSMRRHGRHMRAKSTAAARSTAQRWPIGRALLGVASFCALALGVFLVVRRAAAARSTRRLPAAAAGRRGRAAVGVGYSRATAIVPTSTAQRWLRWPAIAAAVRRRLFVSGRAGDRLARLAAGVWRACCIARSSLNSAQAHRGESARRPLTR